jgi:hypothetical protein
MLRFLLVVLFQLCHLLVIGQSSAVPDSIKKKDIPLKYTKHRAFQDGEVLSYSLSYGFITGGAGQLSVKDTVLFNQSLQHVIASGRTIGVADVLYKVRDQYESFISPETNKPLKAIRSIREGGYNYYNEVIYNRDSSTVQSQLSGRHFVPENILDMLAAFYYARNHNFNEETKIGEVVEFMTYFDDELFPLRIKYRGTEVIRTKFGKVECYKYSPVTEVGRVFETEDDMQVWITRDDNRIPIKIKFDILVGSFVCNLSAFKGLKYPFSSVRQ